ncbi:GMC family oxidoreductase [Georgenia alba]|uniref:GMC family oxidoreductase n=1 Tax=Georgenia alba TaxID=2233858 RepID=A0ABW2Q5P0_9MICO
MRPVRSDRTTGASTGSGGKTLGGSTAVNGMVYNRGNQGDYDALSARGNPGWGWDDMLPVLRRIEDHPLGASHTRGADGPLRLTTVAGTEPLLDDVIQAGGELGWQHTQDLNETDEERIGYTTATIHDGRRSSAATAFLHPVLDRPNLRTALRTHADRIVLDGGRAVGVEGRRDGRTVEYRAAREVILSAGALATPKLLQLSGIGNRESLRTAGVTAVVDSPHVGARLREHRVFSLQFRLTADAGRNRLLSTPEGQQQALAEYRATGGGPMAAPSFDVVGFFKTRTSLHRPDAQLLVAPYSMSLPMNSAEGVQLEREPGLLAIVYPLRPDSEGTVHITSDDPDAPLDIDPAYLATEHDQVTSVDAFRRVRRLFATDPLARWVDHETTPGPDVRTDQEILDHGLTDGGCGYHSVGTAAMGPNDDDVVDPDLRVRGVKDLRVVDASVFPAMISGNLTGPVSALAWRAADLILDDTSSTGRRGA